jgi:hypothetical protein
MNVFLEILVVMGMKKHPTLKTFVMDLLQGYRSALYRVELVFCFAKT